MPSPLPNLPEGGRLTPVPFDSVVGRRPDRPHGPRSRPQQSHDLEASMLEPDLRRPLRVVGPEPTPYSGIAGRFVA